MNELGRNEKRETDLATAVFSWWSSLDNARGDRATLRRCHTPAEVAFTQAYHRLYWQLAKENRVGRERVAALAAVLAHAREHRGGSSFAEQMATGESKSVVSGLRFRRLLAIDEPAELMAGLIRAVRLVGGPVNIYDLASSVVYWGDQTKKRWAFEYYAKAPKED